MPVMTRLFLLVCWLLPGGVLADTQAEPLTTATVERRPLPREHVFASAVEAVAQATVAAQTQGEVEKIYVDVGDEVAAGSTLISLAGINQQAGLRQARAQLEQAQSLYQTRSQDYQRANTLYQRKILPKAQLDSARTARDGAAAALKNAQAALEQAQQQLDYTEVKAAYGGVVSQRLVEVGEIVQPGTPLMSGFDPSRLRLHVDLPQALANTLDTHSTLLIRPAGQTPFTPAKIQLFPTADMISGTRRLRLMLPADTGLYPGQWLDVIIRQPGPEGLLVPQQAVVKRGDIHAVYIAAKPYPQLRQVRVGQPVGSDLHILAGVAVGEQVLLDPQQVLGQRSKVKELQE